MVKYLVMLCTVLALIQLSGKKFISFVNHECLKTIKYVERKKNHLNP